MILKLIIIFFSVLIAFVAIMWMIVYSVIKEKIPNVLSPREEEGYIFDYIIIGAGTTGSVVASILTKHSNSTVLLLEAGSTFGFLSRIPVFATYQQMGLNDWAFMSTPQKHSSKALHNQQQLLPRGKGLGGSSQMNFMLHFEGDDRDFNRWEAEFNLSKWNAKSFQPFIEASRPDYWEMYDIHKGYSKITESIVEAKQEFSHKPWNIRLTRYNVRNGLRWTVYQKYLKPVLGSSNIRIIHSAVAKKLILTPYGEGVATVIVCKRDDRDKEITFTVDARKEVILAAGAYQTPQLLMVSGIGDKEILQKYNIPIQKNLPRVGFNLHDHLNLPIFVSIDVVGPTLNRNALLSFGQMFRYVFTGTGHFANFGVLGHLDSINDTYSISFFGAGAVEESTLMTISNFKRDHFQALFPRYHNSSQEGIVFISTCVQPKSRGTVTIKHSSIHRSPIIDPNYLSERDDVACTIRAVRAAVEIITSSSFASLKPKIFWPKIKECSNFGPFERDFKTNQPSDRYLECILRDVGLTSHHPGGSCSMGKSEADSVVDAQMRVHGIKGVRIVDASILPTPISGNPNSVLITMATRGAIMILKTNEKMT